MSKSRLLSGKVKKITGSELDLDRSLFLNLANAEPDLGTPTINGSILVADVDGTRYWSPSVKVDVTGNLFLGTINSADGSTPIRLTANTIIEDNLTVDGIGIVADLTTQTIRAVDSTTITIVNSVIAQSNLEVQNDLTVNGNFTVLGSTTTINSTTLTVEDKNIELAKNSNSAATSDGAGITVVGPNVPASIIYNADTDTWNFNKTIVGTVQGATSIQDIDDRIDLFFDNDINTTDSSSIVFVPAVEMRSDLTVENDVRVTNSVYANRFVGDGSQLTNLPTFLGYTGSAGFTGSQGEVGYVGSQGEFGFTGSQGEIGYTGSAGPAGGDGSIGYTGSQGEIGYTGSAGPAGGDGSIGYTGSQGDIGYTGSQGDIGYTGSQGEIGYTGSSGLGIFSVEIIGNELIITYDDSSQQNLGRVVGYTGSGGTGGGGGAQFYIGDTPPLNPNVGDTWFDTTRGVLTIYVDDGNSEQWVEVSASGYQGPIGYTGSKGDPGGYTGSQGDIGYTGSQGLAGSGIIDATISGDNLVLTYDDSTQQNVGRVVGYTGSAGSGGVANLYQSGTLAVTVGTVRWYAPYDITVTKSIARIVNSANDDIIILLKKNGTQQVALTIPTGQLTSNVNTTAFTMNTGDYATVDITQVGSGNSTGTDLYLQFEYEAI